MHWILFVFFSRLLSSVGCSTEPVRPVSRKVIRDPPQKLSVNPSSSENAEDSLSLLLMGDTQHYYHCEDVNYPCKLVTEDIRRTFHMARNNSFPAGFKPNQTLLEAQQTTYEIETLIINGDITQNGWQDELEEFHTNWLTNISIPILLGLGNHDYQNNLKTCKNCTHSMLQWYTSYLEKMSLNSDVHKTKNKSETIVAGSMSWTKKMCSANAKTCAHVLQLNNKLDYELDFAFGSVHWNISSPRRYLLNELNRLHNTTLPILVNIHQLNGLDQPKMKKLLAKRVFEESVTNPEKVPKIAVFNAHWHESHNATIECIHGYKVPFIFVGSVPRNRFSFLQMDQNEATITGYEAIDMTLSKGAGFRKLESVKLFGKCEITVRLQFGEVSSNEPTHLASLLEP
ncbi:hypothetical protein L5515_017904 [Caenorhabditis briggsae]|uniref:Calcineurin-like phosphoesterase domain-containing protein n=1 Tax=Caenorhabditis briggsae TaxID=6238 RepID=A0AAE9JRX2_CAEBR|nr:hypothetical protein L5515_017904 [Caenorhabditis briggsae]